MQLYLLGRCGHVRLLSIFLFLCKPCYHMLRCSYPVFRPYNVTRHMPLSGRYRTFILPRPCLRSTSPLLDLSQMYWLWNLRHVENKHVPMPHTHTRSHTTQGNPSKILSSPVAKQT